MARELRGLVHSVHLAWVWGPPAPYQGVNSELVSLGSLTLACLSPPVLTFSGDPHLVCELTLTGVSQALEMGTKT